MAVIKHLFISIILLFPTLSMANMIYAPNDIPLLDNRFRIDPKTQEVTFIFNHSEGYQRVVLVRPDGSKLYKKRHPESVAWVSSKTQNIVTVQNPMAGPWQAIAKLDGDNRIKLLSKMQLRVNRLPLKLYAHEYITTHAALYYDNKIMDNPVYLDNAKLSISLQGIASKKMALYLDDGKHYDELPFDGKLTARLYINLIPGRYLLHIRTKNDIFIRNVNKDAVVFSSPIRYRITKLEYGSDQVQMIFTVDTSEIDPTSVSIDGILKDANNNVVKQVQMHSIDNISEKGTFDSIYKLPHSIYTFSGKAYATTLSGREIELQLPNRVFELLPVFKKQPIIKEQQSEALITQVTEPPVSEKIVPSSIFTNLWVIIAISIALLLLIVGVTIFILRRKNKKQTSDENIVGELNLDELQPMPIDIKDAK